MHAQFKESVKDLRVVYMQLGGSPLRGFLLFRISLLGFSSSGKRTPTADTQDQKYYDFLLGYCKPRLCNRGMVHSGEKSSKHESPSEVYLLSSAIPTAVSAWFGQVSNAVKLLFYIVHS